jgi:tryptophanyl-tRNA synthetase
MRIFSGIQPTGVKHLGNYIGAITQYVAGQERGQAIYCIVDLHATTVAYEPETLRAGVYELAALMLAAGLDPGRSVLFRQSDVPEHSELQWLLMGVTSYGELQRMTQFKDKSEKQRDFISAGLFSYPVLMAADILAYRTDEVPVGDDQRQHVELTRNIAERFNSRFGETLVVPEAVIPTVGARIMDLQNPTNKMSTTGGSAAGTIYITDEPDVILKKFKSAVTDSGRQVVRGPDKRGINNLLDILAVVRGCPVDQLEHEFEGVMYGQFKQAVGEAVIDYLAPVQARYQELRDDHTQLETILGAGAERARLIAAQTVADVQAKMGVGPARNARH